MRLSYKLAEFFFYLEQWMQISRGRLDSKSVKIERLELSGLPRPWWNHFRGEFCFRLYDLCFESWSLGQLDHLENLLAHQLPLLVLGFVLVRHRPRLAWKRNRILYWSWCSLMWKSLYNSYPRQFSWDWPAPCRKWSGPSSLPPACPRSCPQWPIPGTWPCRDPLSQYQPPRPTSAQTGGGQHHQREALGTPGLRGSLAYWPQCLRLNLRKEREREREINNLYISSKHLL